MHCIFFVLIILQLSYAVHAIGASEKVVVGYWGYWESKLLPIEHIPWSQITHINYGFAPVNDDIIPNLSSKAQLSKIVDIAHQHHVKVLLSIGGLLGSKSMSKMASTEDNRTKFTKKIMEWVFEFGLDGIDIDWENPGKDTLGCNTVDYANDADNFLILLQQLRESLDRGFTTIHLRVDVSNNSSSSLSTPIADSVGHKLLTVAVNSTPFFKNSTPLIDVSAYAQIIDWIFVKAYDMYVDKPMTGPNAPLKSSMQEGASTQSFDQAWITWTEAHMPANKIVMGLSFHGYISKPKEDAIQLKRLLVSSHMVRPQGDSEDDLSVVLSPPCPELKRGYSGLWKWRSLVSSGVLLDTKTPGGQWIKNWDQESQTPWLYNPITRYLISYDDPESIAIKVNYTRCKEARGVGIWDLSYDAYTNKQGQLLEVVNRYLYNTSSSFGACLNLNPIASYKVVGPQFNALSTKRVFSKASKISAVNLLLLLVILATGISL